MALTKVSRGLLSTSIVDNGNATAITIDANENVGIGTGSPSTKGHFYSGTSMDQLSVDGAGAIETGINFKSSGTTYGQIYFNNVSPYDMSVLQQYSTGSLIFGTNDTERMRIDSSGNLLVGGTTFDNGNFSSNANGINVVDATHPIVLVKETTSNNTFLMGVTSAAAFLAVQDAIYMAFFTSDAERMRIDASGNLIVGNTFDSAASSVTLQNDGDIRGVLSSGAGGDTVISAISGVSNGYQISVTTGNAQTYKWFNGGTQSMTLDSSGNLLVGTTSASIASTNNTGAVIVPNGASQFSRNGGHALDINRAQDGEIIRFRSAGNIEGSISISGSTTTYNTSSDQRLKNNIVDAPSASDDIDAIQVRSFDWKADGSHQKYGMVAQELQAVAPEAVSGDADSDDMMGVDYSKIVPMLVKEIQSLRARVQQLENN